MAVPLSRPQEQQQQQTDVHIPEDPAAATPHVFVTVKAKEHTKLFELIDEAVSRMEEAHIECTELKTFAFSKCLVMGISCDLDEKQLNRQIVQTIANCLDNLN